MSGGTDIETISGHLADDDDNRLIWFVVCYSNGDEDHREGTLLDASELAATAELTIVPTRDGIFQWVREPIRSPETWDGPSPLTASDAQG